MQSISRNFHQTADADTGMSAGLITRTRIAVLGFLARRDTRVIVRHLSDAQLCDAGIDRGNILGNRPAMDVDPELTRYLASLR